MDLWGIIPDQQECIGTLSFGFSGMQSGPPDALALVDPSSVVVQFLSYEGTFAATDGPASGMTSADIGVSESGTTPVGDSPQLGGTGSQASDFTWQDAASSTEDLPNASQTFLGGCAESSQAGISVR